MKNIFKIPVVVVVGALLLASCDNDDTTNDIPVHTLDVVSAETSYSAVGGTGAITVAENVASAYSNDSWITTATNGNTVTLTVDRNNSKESRHTTVVVKSSAQDSAVVNIDQFGSIFSTTLPQTMQVGNGAQTLKYTYTSDETPNITNTGDWVTTSASDGSLTVNVAANETGGPRRDTLTVTSGINSFTAVITQYDFATDIAGNYYLLDGDSLAAGKMYGSSVQIAADANGQVSINFPTLNLSIPVSWNSTAMSLTMRAGTSMGTLSMQDSTSYYVFADVFATDGYIYWDNSVTYTAPFEYDAEYDELTAMFEDDGSISSSIEVYGISLDAFSTSTVSDDGYAGSLMSFAYPILYKVSGQSSAKALNGRINRKVNSKLTGPRKLQPVKVRSLKIR